MMDDNDMKTPGQVAYETFVSISLRPKLWENLDERSQRRWERVAEVVLRTQWEWQ